MVLSLLKLDPRNRLCFDDLKELPYFDGIDFEKLVDKDLKEDVEDDFIICDSAPEIESSPDWISGVMHKASNMKKAINSKVNELLVKF